MTAVSPSTKPPTPGPAKPVRPGAKALPPALTRWVGPAARARLGSHSNTQTSEPRSAGLRSLTRIDTVNHKSTVVLTRQNECMLVSVSNIGDAYETNSALQLPADPTFAAC